MACWPAERRLWPGGLTRAAPTNLWSYLVPECRLERRQSIRKRIGPHPIVPHPWKSFPNQGRGEKWRLEKMPSKWSNSKSSPNRDCTNLPPPVLSVMVINSVAADGRAGEYRPYMAKGSFFSLSSLDSYFTFSTSHYNYIYSENMASTRNQDSTRFLFYLSDVFTKLFPLHIFLDYPKPF